MVRTKINLECLFIGEEPEWNSKIELPLTRALSWYSNQKDSKDSKAYTIEYAKSIGYDKKSLQILEKVPEDTFTNLGFVCRMTSRGAKLDREDWIKTKINSLLNYTQPKVIQNKNTETIQQRMFDQASVYISEIECHIDTFIKTRKSTFNCYDWLITNSIKPLYTQQIKEHYIPLLTELNSIQTDEQLKEAYSHYTKKEISNFITLVNSIINDCSDYSNNKKPKRIKPKSTSIEKKLTKFKYKKEDVENKLVSINPTNILASSQLWVYNTKYKKLGVYLAKDDSGLSIKNSSIENFNQDSIAKTIRKPKDILPTINKLSKTNMKKLMKDLTTKPEQLTGKINQDTILLKIFK